MAKVVIAGGGAAGMAAAISAAECGNEVTVIEKNEKLGKKLFITGKGRCNITNACDTQDLFQNILSNSKFLYSAIHGYDNYMVMDFFENNGCPVKTERGNRVFPVSDKSSDVIKTLCNRMRQLGVNIFLNCEVKDIDIKDGHINGLKYVDAKNHYRYIECDKLIIATGGKSYPSTGSTGDGYIFAQKAGHTVTRLYPALVPFELKGDEYKQLQGLSLRNVSLSIFSGSKKVYEDFGEMLFTHFGISGPLVLSAGNSVASYIQKNTKDGIYISIDLKPALSKQQLDTRILKDFENNKNKQLKNSLDALLPRTIIPVVITHSGIDDEKMVNSITKEERMALIDAIKELKFEFKNFRDFNEAIITKGGVNVKEINPSTMESKKVSGLFFAGEVMDVDAYTGGFNLQIAWSTGHLAGMDY